MELTAILKSLFTRNTAASSASGAKIPVVNTAGDVIGSDSMANLAAVLGDKMGILQWKGSIPAGNSVSKEINARGFFFVVYENLRVGNCAVGFVGYSSSTITVISDPFGILNSGNYLHISKNGATISFSNEKTNSTSFIMTIVG